MEKEFECYWERHQNDLVRIAPQILREERANVGKMNTAGDWLLFAVPIVAMILFMDYGFFANEVVNFLVGLVMGVVCFALSVLVRPFVTGKRNVSDIDRDIRQHFYRLYREKGLSYLDELLKG